MAVRQESRNQECRRAGIPADMQTDVQKYRCANIDKVNNLHNKIFFKKCNKLGLIQVLCRVTIDAQNPSSFGSFTCCLLYNQLRSLTYRNGQFLL
jgi:hypothetical protein